MGIRINVVVGAEISALLCERKSLVAGSWRRISFFFLELMSEQEEGESIPLQRFTRVISVEKVPLKK